ncbi:MAG: hypothetical protein ACTSP4_06520 [Candidatus Hodarchaeales archaeon]
MTDQDKKKKDSLGKLAFDASKSIVSATARAAGRKVWDEVKNVKDMTVEEIKKTPVLKNISINRNDFQERPEDVRRREFYVKTRPTRSYTQSVRTIHHAFRAAEHGDPKRRKEVRKERRPKDPAITPGMDGLLSFSILMAPFAILLGILYVAIPNIEPLLFILFVFYLLLIAIPGAYLGVDAIFYGARYTIIGGAETARFFGVAVIEMIKILVLGIWELFMFFLTALFGFAKGAFDSFESWWAFVFSYTVSALILYFGISYGFPSIAADFSLTKVLLLVLLPSLLPAAFAHRQWSLYRYRRRYAGSY